MGFAWWCFKFGESAQEACVREFLEETGLKVKVKSLLGVSTNFIQHYPNQDVAQAVTIEFIVELVEEMSKEISSETLDLKYFSKDKLPKILTSNIDFLLIITLMKTIHLLIKGEGIA